MKPPNKADSGESSADNAGEESISKSERKRQMHRLQALGTALVDLKPGIIEELNPSSTLIDAIALARNTKKHEALRRQLQFIGKLMRKEDPLVVERMEQLLNDLHSHKAQQNDDLHLNEQWRDRILGDAPNAIEEFISRYPGADRQWLRQIRRQHLQETASHRPPVAARKLFGYLRDIIQTSSRG